MIGIQLIIIISIVSMFIAYLGDILGKRIGKKRISVFGLRPRMTAMLITIAVGAVISITTFLLLITFSSQMRQMLTKTEEIQKERDALQSEVQDLKGDVIQLSDNIITATSQHDKIKYQSDVYKNDLELLGNEIIGKTGELDELTVNQTQLETTINNLEDQLELSDEQYKSANKKLVDVKDQLNNTNEEIQFVRTEITYLESEKKTKENQIVELENSINKLLSDINRMHSEIKRMQTEDIAFFEGQRLYGFTISNELFLKQIMDVIEKSFRNFDEGEEYYNLGCKIKEPSSEDLYYDIIEKVKDSSSDESMILVFAGKNCFRGDEIPVNFHVYDQYVVFTSGSLIIEEKVEKKLNLFEARDLASKMIHDACSKALNRGLLHDAFGQVSKVSPQLLNEIAKNIVHHRRPMLVQLAATEDILRGVYLDGTNMEFKITDG